MANKKKWIVMVFMGTSHPTGGPPLDAEAKSNLAELERIGSADRLDLFVQVMSQNKSFRLHVSKGKRVPLSATELRQQDNSVLAAFVDWVLGSTRKVDDNTGLVLVLWGHGFRFTVSHRPTGTGIDAMDFAEIRNVLQQVTDRIGRKLDLVGFDACDLSTIEVAVSLSPFAEYLVASEMGIPLPGWPYDKVLSQLRQSGDHAPMTAENLGEYIVRKFCENYSDHPERKNLPASLTLLDLQNAKPVFAALEKLAEAISSMESPHSDTELALLDMAFALSQTIKDRPFVDVARMCFVLWTSSRDPRISEAAAAVGDLLIRPDRSATGRGSLIVEHGRNSHEATGLEGLSAYAPSVAPDHDVEAARDAYSLLANGVPAAQLAPGQGTKWSRLIYAMKKPQ